jgi:hypothetical protein
MRKFILEKLLYLSNVEKPSVIPVRGKYRKEFTLERNPMCVNNVAKPSFTLSKTWGHTKLTLKRNYISIVESHPFFECLAKTQTITEQIPYVLVWV